MRVLYIIKPTTDIVLYEILLNLKDQPKKQEQVVSQIGEGRRHTHTFGFLRMPFLKLKKHSSEFISKGRRTDRIIKGI